MLSQLEQACKTYSTEFSCGLIEFDSDWQRIFVTALTFHLDQAIYEIFSRNSSNNYRVSIKGFRVSSNDFQLSNKYFRVKFSSIEWEFSCLQ